MSDRGAEVSAPGAYALRGSALCGATLVEPIRGPTATAVKAYGAEVPDEDPQTDE